MTAGVRGRRPEADRVNLRTPAREAEVLAGRADPWRRPVPGSAVMVLAGAAPVPGTPAGQPAVSPHVLPARPADVTVSAGHVAVSWGDVAVSRVVGVGALMGQERVRWAR